MGIKGKSGRNAGISPAFFTTARLLSYLPRQSPLNHASNPNPFLFTIRTCPFSELIPFKEVSSSTFAACWALPNIKCAISSLFHKALKISWKWLAFHLPRLPATARARAKLFFIIKTFRCNYWVENGRESHDSNSLVLTTAPWNRDLSTLVMMLLHPYRLTSGRC